MISIYTIGISSLIDIKGWKNFNTVYMFYNNTRKAIRFISEPRNFPKLSYSSEMKLSENHTMSRRWAIIIERSQTSWLRSAK